LPAADVATGAVRSYRTFSPLPACQGWSPDPHRLCVFCATGPSGRPDRPL